MFKFNIVDLGGHKRDIGWAVNELKRENLIVGTEKDVNNDTVYHTHNIKAVKRIMEDYEGLMVDLCKE